MTAFNSIKTNNWPAASNANADFIMSAVYWDEPGFYTPTRAGSTTLFDYPLTSTIANSTLPLTGNSFNVTRYVQFAGNSSTSVRYPASFALPAGTEFTIDFYYKKTSSGWTPVLGNWASNGAGAQISLGINGTTSANWDYYFGIEGGTYQNQGQSTNWNATQWCHYRHEYVKSTRLFRSWTNGTLTGSITVTSPGIRYIPSNTLHIGHQGDGSNGINQDQVGPIRISNKALGAPPTGGLLLNADGRF